MFFVALITFVLMHAAPGGPWDRDLEARQVDKTTQALLSKRFGMDKPLFFNTSGGNPLDSQFFNYILGAVRGDLGPSYRQRGQDVQDILFKPPEGKPFWYSKFGFSLRLGILAVFLATLFGVPLGILGALKRNTFWDYISLLISTIGVSVPNFVLAIFFIIIFASRLKLIKIVQQNWNSPGAWLVPATILGFGTFAFITRLTRSSMLEVMQMDYVRTARAKGLAERVVIFRHMLRNALDSRRHDPGSGAGRSGCRLLHHRADVFLPGQRSRVRALHSAARLLDDHGHDADLRGVGGAREPHGRRRLRLP